MKTLCSSGAAAAVAFAMACSGTTSDLPLSAPRPSADIQDPVAGTNDLGNDPAVVAIDSGGVASCSGTLVASDLVLTTRHCVSFSDEETACNVVERPPAPLREATSLGVRVTDGSDFFASRVRARSIVVPPAEGPCRADVALVWLEQPIDSVQPLAVHKRGMARGAHVRSVGFKADVSGAFRVVKRVQDHVDVLDTTPTELLLREASCTLGCGGPAIDESSGDLVGILSRGGPAGDVATRADAFLPFIEQTLAQSAPRNRSSGVQREKKGPVDMGANCAASSDCAASVCLTEGARRYCTRVCSGHDHCPPHFHCASTSQGASVCVEK